MATRKTATSIGITTTTRDALALESLTLSAQLGRRISMGDIVLATLTVAKNHRDELISELTTEGTETHE